MWTAVHRRLGQQRIQQRIEDSDGPRFIDRLHFARCAFWQPPTGRIPLPTERSYPPSSWRLIEEYVSRYV